MALPAFQSDRHQPLGALYGTQGVTKEEAKRCFYEPPGVPVSVGQVKELVTRTVRGLPVGATVAALPPGTRD